MKNINPSICHFIVYVLFIHLPAESWLGLASGEVKTVTCKRPITSREKNTKKKKKSIIIIIPMEDTDLSGSERQYVLHYSRCCLRNTQQLPWIINRKEYEKVRTITYKLKDGTIALRRNASCSLGFSISF